MLDGLRVLDLSDGIAGGYTTKLLADAGADVVHVEPPGGDPLREYSASGGAPGALYAFLHGGHRSIVGTPADDEVRDLARRADLLIESLGPADDTARRLRDTDPALVVVSLSPFGLAGPWADRPATEFTIQALCGSTASRGIASRPPVYAAGRLAEWYTGPYAATAALGALRRARRTGRGAHVDLSMLEVGCVTMNQYSTIMNDFIGWPDMPARARMIEIPSVEPTADGWVGFSTITGQQFQDFLVLIEAFDWLDDPEIASHMGRIKRADEILEVVHRWTTRRTTAEIIEKATALRIPVAPIGRGDTVTAFDHFVERGVYRDHPDGFTAPRRPYRVSGLDDPPFRRASTLGADTGRIDWPERETPSPPAGATAEPDLPLDGVRIVDFTMFWAGPSATHALGALGADVVKVESVQRPDGMRFQTPYPPSIDGWWEFGFLFHGVNPNKRDVTLDLDDDRGRGLARRLIADADVVVENFSPRVMERFGLDADGIHEINPSALVVRMPAFGLSGPWRDRTGWANTMEQISGMAWITGYPETQPMIPRGQIDPVVGLHSAFAILAALEQRDRDGAGRLVELPMIEVALNVAAEQVIEWSAAGIVLERDGNRGPVAAPQGVYGCAGKERWLALAVVTDDHWVALRRILGDPSWAADPALADIDGRRRAADRIDGELTAAFAERDLDGTVDALLAAGVPAAPVVAPREIRHHPQLEGRGFFEPVEHPVSGKTIHVPGLPWRHESVPRWIRRAAPSLGQDNDEILGSIGVDADAIERLRADDVIGERPLGV